MLLASKPIKEVIVTFEDGSTEAFKPNEQAGFFRERMTYECEENSSAKVKNVLRVYEIFWAERYPNANPR